MTFEKAFESVKSKFANSNARGIDDFAVQITLTDSDCGGTLYAEVKNGVLYVEPYDYRDNNAALTISKSALLAFLGKRMSLEAALSDEGSSVYGDATKIAALRKLVSFEKRNYTRKNAKTEKQEAAEEKGAEIVKKSTTKNAAPKAKTERKLRATKRTKK